MTLPCTLTRDANEMKDFLNRSSRTGYPLIALALAITGVVNAQQPEIPWSQFQNGGYPEAEANSLVVSWSPNENIAWQAAIEGYGQSAPVVAGALVYVTSVSGDQRDTYHLTAFRVSDGDVIWKRDFSNPTPQENTSMTSRAAPTPIADSEGCIAFFEGGLIVSVGRDGTLRWIRNLVDEYGPIQARHGLAASPEQNDSNVFVWVERMNDPYILALDKAEGRNLWKVEGLKSTSWSSPRLIAVDQESHLVCSASGKIVGIDPASGRKLWEFTEIANNTSCTPIPVGRNRFLIGASEGRGEESSGPAAAHNGLIEVKRNGEGYDVSFVWRAEKASSSFGTPIVAKDTVCVVNRAGVLYRLQLETGEQISASRVAAGSIWATPMVADQRLYLFGYQGTTSVIALPTGDELAENRLWNADAEPGVLYAAAAAPPYLLLRRGDRLYAVGASK